jgi:heme/copper-type cytochrome/quinol oxidase subunit 2
MRSPISLLVIACLAATGLALAGTRLFGRQLVNSSHGNALEVHAVAHQWWWEFDYPALGVRSVNVLQVPSGRDLRLELTSADVLHSFWLPSMPRSVEVVPNQISRLTILHPREGILDGSCDAGCSCGSVCMPFKLVVASTSGFQRWVQQIRAHPPKLPSKPGTTPPCALGAGEPPAKGARPPAANRLQAILNG